MRFKPKTKFGISMMITFIMLFQIIGPVAYAYADNGLGFKILNVDIVDVDKETNEGNAIVHWQLTLDADYEAEVYTHGGNFTVEEEKTGPILADDGTVIGEYTVSTDGFITVTTDGSLKDVIEEEEIIVPEIPVEPEQPIAPEIPEEEKSEENIDEEKEDIEETSPKEIEHSENEDGDQTEEPSSKENGEEPEKDGEESDMARFLDNIVATATGAIGSAAGKAMEVLETVQMKVALLSSSEETEEETEKAPKIISFEGSFVIEGVEEKSPFDLFGMLGLFSSSITDNLITSVGMYDEEPAYEGEDEDRELIIKGKNIATDDVRLDTGAMVAVIYEWVLPENHGYYAGATYTFDLPNKFVVANQIIGDLDGGVGTYVVSPTGTVTFTFNEEINDQNKLAGNFYVWRKFDSTKFTGSLKQEIDFSSVGQSNITVHFNHTNPGKGITKEGAPSATMNPDKIEWVVDFNLNEDTISNAKFLDTFPTGLTLDNDSVKIEELTVNLNGSLTVGSDVTSTLSGHITKDSNELSINFGNIEKAYRVRYATKVDPILDDPYSIMHENLVVISSNENPELFKEKATATVQFSKPLSKASTGYNENTQKISWEIEYNFNEQSILASKAVLIDTFDTNYQQLDINSFVVREATISSSGQGTPTGLALTKDSDYTVTPNANGFVLSFNSNITKAYIIKYETTAIDISKEGDRVHADRTLSNKVEFGTISKTGDVDIEQGIFRKSQGNINYADKTIEWHILLNNDMKNMSNVVIEDIFGGQHLTFDPDSLTITGLSSPSDYTVEPNLDYGAGFKITFKDPITTSHKITYKTTYDSTKPAPTGGYHNNGEVKWTEGSTNYTKKSSVTDVRLDDYSGDNGNKKGAYNAKTKEITWTIDVNYNLHNITNAILRDQYTGEQSFVEGSLKVHHLTLSGRADGVTVGDSVSVTKEENTPSTRQYQLTENGFTLNLGEINSAYRITYRTSLEDEVIKGSYTNEAELTGGSPVTSYFKKGATVIPSHGEEYIRKKGTQGTGADGDIATWEVGINYSQSHITTGSVLTDTLSANQILLQDSFELYETVIPSDNTGTVTKGTKIDLEDSVEYTLNITGNSFTLTFNEAVSKAYILVYKSFINAGNNEKISNSALYNGKYAESSEGSMKWETTVHFAGAGGGANPPKGELVIKKVDNDGNPIADVIFELYNKAGNILLETLITDSNGEAKTIKTYKYHATSGIEYMLKEISAPEGYIINLEYAAGKIIKFMGSSKVIEIENAKVRQAVELTKLDSTDNSPLEGVKFELRKKDTDDQYKVVSGYASLTTDSSGKLYIGDLLQPGQYQLIEIEAKENYWLDDTPTSFTITANQTSVITRTVYNTKLGDIIIKKIDESGASLGGAVFTLRNGADTYTSQEDALEEGTLVFENVKYGTYQLEETTTPSGYVGLSGTKTIVVNDTTNIIEDPDAVADTITNEKIHQAVKLTKIETGNPLNLLRGAEFTLYQEDGTKISEHITDSNGEITVNNLIPGKYYFEETKAPDYYLLPTNTRTGVFTIVPNQTTIETVTMTNDRGIGSIVVKKIDALDNNILLEGVEFKLYDSKGTELGSATTGVDGTITFNNLPYDTYTLEETAPKDGYIAASSTIEIVLNGITNNITVEEDVENEPLRTLVIKKIDARDNTRVLAGAEFKITKLGGATVEATTDENGLIELEELEFGSYTIAEIKAPSGYRLNTNMDIVTIDENSSLVIEIKIENTRRPSGGGGGGGTDPKDPEEPTTPGETPKPVEPTNPTTPGETPEVPTAPTEPTVPSETPEVPEEPVIKEETPKETPKEGEIPVPDESTPEVGTPPTNGTVTVDKDGKWRYTPNPGFTGKDKFTIKITHPDGTEEEILIEIDVEEIPLGTITPDGTEKLPQTGEGTLLNNYLIGGLMALLGYVVLRKKKDSQEA